MSIDTYSVVLLSGGSGMRMNNTMPKQYMMMSGKPIIMHTLERVDQIDSVDEIVIVCKPEYEKIIQEYIANYHLVKNYKIAQAGKTRQESVFNGLLQVKNKNVIIHEAARPFVKKEEFLELIDYPGTNVTLGSPINYTVLIQTEGIIDGLLQRDTLVNIQLPQKFDAKMLLTCHEKAIADNKVFTEDASLVFFYTKEKISVIRGKEYNLKITTPEDVIVGERLYNEYFVGR